MASLRETITVGVAVAFVSIVAVMGVMLLHNPSSAQGVDEPSCGIYPLINCDLNGDGGVSLADVGIVLAQVGQLVGTSSPTNTAVPTPTNTPVPPSPTPAPVGSRDKFKQPFASTSIWNMPIGSGAVYVPANIAPVDHGTFAEEAIIINRPNLALQTIYHSTLHPNNWNSGTRCNQAGSAFTAPVPLDFYIPDNGGAHGGTPNHPSGIMTADGNSYTESQPLTHCPGKPYTTGYVNGTYSIYGDGRFGSQGGSHMSGVGGVIRAGEWAAARQRGYFNHALKTVLDSGPNFGTTAGPDCNIPGCRWPASGSDCGNTACGYGGGSSHAKVKMGTLLAVAPSYNCAGLRTEPGRIYCNTAKNYGIYIVDSGWSTYYIPIEYSPDGSSSAEFQQQFGMDLDQASTTAPWPADIRDIFANAQVVDNNGPTNIGGGGTPRVPLAPPIGN